MIHTWRAAVRFSDAGSSRPEAAEERKSVLSLGIATERQDSSRDVDETAAAIFSP